ncbi:hypothetical protein PUMCH_003554 [Australozyma saopauloensis]|uniref:tRNA (uracil-O(2)-)-methyltransferase n=1 Tax=Australozyma saopauloensis TaxID=291208 RepID=A0AAX4HCU5_9ASCO|nr:hypothetical protein PUMCH_003554 [[Candida] saopauloensis]
MKKSPQDLPMQVLLKEPSYLGPLWLPVYETQAEFEAEHFETAMNHLIREPNINSTVILRADLLEQIAFDENLNVVTHQTDVPELPSFPDQNGSIAPILHRDLDDTTLRRELPILEDTGLQLSSAYLRRIIPRNPSKDHIINQTCLLFKATDSVLVVYIPHIDKQDEVPFYLPPVCAVGILYCRGKISIHYIPFPDDKDLLTLDASDRPVRIALRLLQTLAKHSKGVKGGYEKRVNHDMVVPRVAFQNRYIELKRKYSGDLVANWVESTDPKKHVFEDLAVAAFLIELWKSCYKDKEFEFRDLGCGNGLLVHILILEGFKGKGIDARARKSWKTYPALVQENLLEQIIMPHILLKLHPSMSKAVPFIAGRLFQVPEYNKKNLDGVPLIKYYSSENLLESPQVCTTDEFPANTFIIGNHLDELTCWMPLLGYPFMVIPCCSHSLSGAKVRYTPRKATTKQAQNLSTYGALVDHVEDLANSMGWEVQKEILRIPSTRNSAIIGLEMNEQRRDETAEQRDIRVWDIIYGEGGAEGWVQNLLALMAKSPKNH